MNDAMRIAVASIELSCWLGCRGCIVATPELTLFVPMGYIDFSRCDHFPPEVSILVIGGGFEVAG